MKTDNKSAFDRGEAVKLRRGVWVKGAGCRQQFLDCDNSILRMGVGMVALQATNNSTNYG